MFSERNSEAMNAADNSDWGSVNQDDYDTWVGEAALVKSGAGAHANEVGLDTTATTKAAIIFMPTATPNSCARDARAPINSPTTSFATLCPMRRNEAIDIRRAATQQQNPGGMRLQSPITKAPR